MSRLAELRRAARARPAAWAALAFLGLTLVTALGADLVASDKPVAARLAGELFLLPAIFDPPALRPHDLESLRRGLGPGDWMLEPLVPWGPAQQDKGHAALEPPSARHLLGTDTARRDVLARLVHGSRVALVVGLGSVAIYVLIGTLLGAAAGYFGGVLDALVSRSVEVLLSVPTFFLLLAVMGVREQAGAGTVVLVLGLVSWTRVAVLTRAEARRVRGLEFVQAAEALGLPRARVLFAHVLPSALTPALVSASFGVAAVILTEASLSFLGFGVPDEVATWGGIMHGALRDFGAWWLVAFPGGALFATVAAYNLLGDVVRDVLDPRVTD